MRLEWGMKRKGRYWEKEGKRICRLCEGEIETWEHVWEGCRVRTTGGKVGRKRWSGY